MKIAVAQINPKVGDIDGNCTKISSYATLAKEKGCDLVVFPELCITGYPPQDLLERDDFFNRAIAGLKQLIAEISGIGVICGNIEIDETPHGKKIYNAAYLFENGTLLHTVHKKSLSTDDIFDEKRFFEPGTNNTPVFYKHQLLGIHVGEISPTDDDLPDSMLSSVENGASVVISISAIPFCKGAYAKRQTHFMEMAKRYGIPFVMGNQVGGNDSLLFDGGSFAISSKGHVSAQAALFEEDLIQFDLTTHMGDIRPIETNETEQILSALIMGVRDYLKKTGFRKVIVGVSGGVDSALVLYIAVKAVGSENVHAVFMPSRYTSIESLEDTEQLIRTLDVRYEKIEIDSLFQDMMSRVASDFNPQKPAVVHQNLQARIRGILLMAISNKEGSILLSTGNKSELAVGYCTLYGDMCGGLSVISDVWKTTVWELCHHINQEKEIIPTRIITKAPSAELSPDQKDEDELPPYEVLDLILEGYIEHQKSIEELAASGCAIETIRDIVDRVCRNEYKRFQAAPGLKISPKAFGSGRRYPLAAKCEK